MPKIRAIFLDCGDTLVDQSTEVKDEHQVSQKADLIPGAAELVHELRTIIEWTVRGRFRFHPETARVGVLSTGKTERRGAWAPRRPQERSRARQRTEDPPTRAWKGWSAISSQIGSECSMHG